MADELLHTGLPLPRTGANRLITEGAHVLRADFALCGHRLPSVEKGTIKLLGGHDAAFEREAGEVHRASGHRSPRYQERGLFASSTPGSSRLAFACSASSSTRTCSLRAQGAPASARSATSVSLLEARLRRVS